MHWSGLGVNREQRVRQVKSGDASISDFESYIPIGNADEKLRQWAGQGAVISYLSSHSNYKDIEKDRLVLQRYKFPQGDIFYRQSDDTYADIVIREMPDAFIEDNCESIGGGKEMASTHLSPDVEKKIHIRTVPEFDGIDHLPDKIADL